LVFFFFSRVLVVVNAEDLDEDDEDVEQHLERNEQRCVVDISRGNGNKALSRVRYLKGVLCG
jgi:hypothetical protein